MRVYTTVNTKKIYSSLSSIASAGASGYKIYRATSKNGKYRLIKDAKASQRSYTSTNLKTKKTYYYKMRAYRVVSEKKVHSTYSAVKKIKTK